MKCEEVRDELVAYARGELDDARKAAIEEHLARCAGCTQELEGARQVMAVTRMADDASVAEVVRHLIKTAIKDGASDLHLERAGGEPRVRLRIDGLLYPGPIIVPEQYALLVARIKVMADQNVTERRVPQDGRIGISHEGKEYDLRVSTVPYSDGESVVLRILDRSSVFVGLERLGFLPDALKQVEALISRRQGLLLTTGPTGAGKSTLLYSILNRLNRPEVKILTVEDPVEYRLPGLNQLAVNRRAGVTFATGMRALMRQDPDLFMVSGLPDLETAELCVQAALTGHMVLSALHTRDTTEAFTRLFDMGVAPFLAAATVHGVIGQRLVRRTCPACKEAYQPPAAILEALGFTAEARRQPFVHGAGCDACAGTGYRGRTGLFELLTLNQELARMVAAREPEVSLRARALDLGALWPFEKDAARKIGAGVTTAEEVDRVLLDPIGTGTG
jgi:type II secretory ATPase GspE/PulE/Tfp pilus assembly ATPase PilB-like protein